MFFCFHWLEPSNPYSASARNPCLARQTPHEWEWTTMVKRTQFTQDHRPVIVKISSREAFCTDPAQTPFTLLPENGQSAWQDNGGCANVAQLFYKPHKGHTIRFNSLFEWHDFYTKASLKSTRGPTGVDLGLSRDLARAFPLGFGRAWTKKIEYRKHAAWRGFTKKVSRASLFPGQGC